MGVYTVREHVQFLSPLRVFALCLVCRFDAFYVVPGSWILSILYICRFDPFDLCIVDRNIIVLLNLLNTDRQVV